jgi:tRNA (mo5U34)-methyltransferase
MDSADVQQRVDSYKNWYHRIPLMPGITTPGVNDTESCLSLLHLPGDLRGMRVLDIGARDGFYSFECERRGADVVAIDYMPPERTGFPIARAILNARVEMMQENLYQLSPEKWGTFDLVLCLGVLYHLRDPLLALDIVRSLTRHRLILETHVIDEALLMWDGTKRSLSEVAPHLRGVPLMQ